MGVWGSGNFENDPARDYLSDLAQQQVAAIEEAMKDSRAIEPDEWEGQIVPCRIDVICALWERFGCGCGLPDQGVLTEWRTRFLDVWDNYIDKLSPRPEYKKERRAVLVQTFDRLEKVAREQERGWCP